MIHKIIVSIVIGILLSGCGTSQDSVENVNLNKSSNEYGFYGELVLFADQVVTGVWAQYELDDNGTAKETVAFKHKFDNKGIRSIQVPLLGETWYPIGEYGVNTQGTKIFFRESNTSIGYYHYVARDENNCTIIAQYSNKDATKKLKDTYLFCKEY